MKKVYALSILIIMLLFSACKKESTTENVNDSGKQTAGGLITASARWQLVESSAKKISQNSSLINIRSYDVDIKGYSKKWFYEYRLVENRTVDSSLYFNSTIDEVKFDSISTIRKVGNAVITHSWMDSDKAMQIAENNGGKEFRNQYSDYLIEAVLGEPVIAYPTTFWYITYKRQKDASVRLKFIIDANTGAISTF